MARTKTAGQRCCGALASPGVAWVCRRGSSHHGGLQVGGGGGGAGRLQQAWRPLKGGAGAACMITCAVRRHACVSGCWLRLAGWLVTQTVAGEPVRACMHARSTAQAAGH